MEANVAINWLKNNDMVAYSKRFQLKFLTSNKNFEREILFTGEAKSIFRIQFRYYVLN